LILKRFQLAILFSLFCFFAHKVQAHKNFWEIRAFVFEGEKQISIQAFFSLEHLQPHLKSTFKNDLYEIKNKEQLVEDLTASASRLIDLKVDGEAALPFIRTVNIFTDDIEDSKPQDFPISLVDIEVEFVLSMPLKPSKISVIWKIFPNEIIKRKNINIKDLPVDALNVNINLSGTQTKKFIITKQKPEFSWTPNQLSTSVTLPVKYLEVSINKASNSHITLVLFSLLLAFSSWAFLPSRKSSSLILISLLMAIGALSYANLNRETVKKAELQNNDLEKPFKEILRRIYSSVNSTSDKKKWAYLDGVVTKPFQQKLYIDNYSSLLAGQDKMLEKIEIVSLKKESMNSLFCEWNIVTLVQHKSHIHEKKLAFTGTFTFAQDKNSWFLNNAEINRGLTQ
jgi:hypothetical protein